MACVGNGYKSVLHIVVGVEVKLVELFIRKETYVECDVEVVVLYAF